MAVAVGHIVIVFIEVPSIEVVHITVTIVVNAVALFFVYSTIPIQVLAWTDPYLIRQIGMIHIDARVHHAHDNTLPVDAKLVPHPDGSDIRHSPRYVVQMPRWVPRNILVIKRVLEFPVEHDRFDLGMLLLTDSQKGRCNFTDDAIGNPQGPKATDSASRLATA